MGFTNGFTGGVTLTLGVAYLTVLAHERNRQAQAAALRSQSRVLTSLLEPAPLPKPQTRAELAREERSNLVETAKDRWNEEVESAVRWVQRTDFNEVREGMEGAVARLLGFGLEKSREGVNDAEKKAGSTVQEAVESSRAKAKEEASRIPALAREKADKAAAEAKAQFDHARIQATEKRDAAKAKADQAVAEAKSSLHDAAESIRHSGGTVDAARGVVRDAISKGIEKGKEVVGKAQSAVGLAAEKIESTTTSAQSATGLSSVEKTLQQRYEQPSGLEKSVAEILEDRYKPIDERDNTVLRGV